MEDAEIVFAQKLASGEPVTRKRALRTLNDWIRKESASKEFGVDSMERLCKGLHYVMWMQDKALLQEELADNISSLLTVFQNEQQSVLFIKQMLVTVSDQWAQMDRWRMDKFLMLMRRLLRSLFVHLRKNEWNPILVDTYMKAFQECAISSDKKFCEGLKFHFASVFLDELDYAGGLEPGRVTELLRPFANLLADRQISGYLFDSILREIFLTILHDYADQKAAAAEASNADEGDEDEGMDGDETEGMEQEEEESGAAASDSSRIKFNYAEIGQMLFDIGKRPEVKSDRRKRLYRVSKRFKAADAGGDPFKMVSKAETRLKAQIPKKEIQDAVSRLLNEKAKDALLRKKAKLRKKRSGAEKSQEALHSDAEDRPKTKLAKKMKKTVRKKGAMKSNRKREVSKRGDRKKRPKGVKGKN